MKHTPGEMTIEKAKGANPYYELWIGLTYIGSVKESDNIITPETGLANAERVVKCWNEYDKLKGEINNLKGTISAMHKQIEKLISSKK